MTAGQTRGISLGLLLLVAACSLRNREGPNVSCEELDQGARNACSEGIIGTCAAGAVTFEVCDDADACEAAWQSPGRYACTEAEASKLPASSDAGRGGAAGQGGGGQGPTRVCDFDFKKAECGACFSETDCCQAFSACSSDADCSSCLKRSGAEPPCVPDTSPAFDAVAACLSSMCAAECQ